MSLFVASLNSGSNGNCYYIGNAHEAILVDAGISCRETETRMRRLHLSMQNVKAIFISHEHSDHIRGVAMLSKKYRLPVYITPLTCHHSGLLLDDNLVFPFVGHQPISIGGFTVIAFPKLHDAAHPHSFTISYRDIKVGIFTDIGAPCDNLTAHFKQCHAAFLEANYDEEMLEKGRYPYYLKKRIRGGNGHLSNSQALRVFTAHRAPFLSHLFLAHLSKDNNCPELVYNLFNSHAGETKVIVASRFKETAVYHIGNRITEEAVHSRGQLQFSLF